MAFQHHALIEQVSAGTAGRCGAVASTSDGVAAKHSGRFLCGFAELVGCGQVVKERVTSTCSDEDAVTQSWVRRAY